MQAEVFHTEWDKRDAIVLRAGRYEALAVPLAGRKCAEAYPAVTRAASR